jgi:lipopolysaccharide transport system ATP-binding protein
MSETVIRVEQLAKQYRLGVQKKQPKNIGQAIKGVISSPFDYLRSTLSKPEAEEVYWALKDISFEVRQGDVVGVIGRNGAGKSTLLKILSQITEPTAGYAEIRGRVGSLLEVGTGFHPDLTGRENIYLNGTILGMTKREIQCSFDEIVAFAEVEKFIDTPVKFYSSGMYTRLAFAVAAHLQPEILIVDEVLAVGDAQFQKKCLGKMSEVARGGRTVIFVSHNMAAIKTLCSTGLVLEQGRVVCSGEIGDCIEAYEVGSFQGQGSTWIRPLNRGSSNLEILEINLTLNGEQPNLLLEIEVFLESKSKHKPAFLAFDILSLNGTGLMQAIPQFEGFLMDTNSTHQANVTLQLPPLIPGRYLITTWVGSHNTETLDEVNEAVAFEVYESPTPGRSFPHSVEHGYIVPISMISLNSEKVLHH